MSRFDDPQFVADMKADIVSYMLTGKPSRAMQDDRPRALRAVITTTRYWQDWELKAVVTAIRDANGGPYAELAHRNLKIRSVKSVLAKVEEAGGRQAFLQKYGEL